MESYIALFTLPQVVHVIKKILNVRLNVFINLRNIKLGK